jgi:hypothetical protein
MNLSDVPLHQLVNVPILVFPVAVCLEIVLSGPPFRLAVYTRYTDEAFERTFSGSFTMFCGLVMAIEIVGG